MRSPINNSTSCIHLPGSAHTYTPTHKTLQLPQAPFLEGLLQQQRLMLLHTAAQTCILRCSGANRRLGAAQDMHAMQQQHADTSSETRHPLSFQLLNTPGTSSCRPCLKRAAKPAASVTTKVSGCSTSTSNKRLTFRNQNFCACVPLHSSRTKSNATATLCARQQNWHGRHCRRNAAGTTLLAA